MKNLVFLAVGVAIGFVLAKVVEQAIADQDANALADDIHERLEVLEGQLA
ncbi:MAG: hypothetical protein JNM28_06460 [Armatimonadetes bacterium]|nr:hypothetical protein [Armatimonadota bacterium]MBS1711647.1 hypothetical protein [Armatimonadota bacterium]MBX3109798.1 hypothetical protein [Fimbriimonadaceae bacterium]